MGLIQRAIVAALPLVFVFSSLARADDTFEYIDVDLWEFEFAPSNPDVVYFRGSQCECGSIYVLKRSTDGGRTFDKCGPLPDCQNRNLSAFAVHRSDENTVYASGGGFWITTDSGSNWSQLDEGSVLAGHYVEHLVIDRQDPQIIYALARKHAHAI